MRLDTIDWTAALRAGREMAAAERLSPRAAADLESLSALFAPTFDTAIGQLARARTAEPFNPAHAARLVLVLMRFGDWNGASTLAEKLAEAAGGLALPMYLRALAALRQEEPKRAANLAADALTAHPKFWPARFLRAEALMRTQLKGVRKHLSDLPRGGGSVAAWADLVAKMLLSGSDDVAKVAAPLVRDTRIFPEGSRASQVVALAATLAAETPEQLEQRLAQVPEGSRAEELILLLIHDGLQGATAQEAVARARRIYDRLSNRPAVRRLYVSVLTRLAVARASEERYTDAIRLVEACLRLEPHETAHFQNRAALFTLTRETDSYHAAWFELNRHQYRLALLGTLSPDAAARLAKPHRLFAQQARLSPAQGAIKSDAGVFVEALRPSDAEKTKTLAVNQEKLDDDPDLLRQWIHHHRAELVFSHLALGPDARRFLLHPDNRKVARARVAGLAETAKSLAVLVPAEGQMLGASIVKQWTAAAERVTVTYAAAPDDADVKELQTRHVETVADLCMICLRWQPDGRRPELTNEVLAFLAGVAPFFDEKALACVIKSHPGRLPYALGLLTGYVDHLLGIESAHQRALTDHERLCVTNGLAAGLLVRQAHRTYVAYRDAGNAVPRAMAFVERARELDPKNLAALLTAARFFLMESHYDDARTVLGLAQQSPHAKDPDAAEEIEELRKVLEERRKVADKGRARDEAPGPATAPEDNVAAGLEGEIEKFPSNIRSYEELVAHLAATGRFADAVEWSALAMDRCSARDAQLRARSLNLEVLGLQVLAERDQNAVRLYLAGAHRPALEVISGQSASARPYTLSYLLGRCLLAVNQPEQARQVFESALAGCERSSHRVVLRQLAADVDQAYLQVARRNIQDKLAAGAFEEAAGEVGAMMGRLRRPEAGFIDLVRVHTAAATARLGTDIAPLARPAGAGNGKWAERVAAAYAARSDRERARRLLDLCREVDPKADPVLDQLAQRLAALEEQAVIADTLARSGELLRAGKIPEALAALEGAPNEPRIVRQRALLLLKLERFDEADATAAAVRGSTTPVAREFQSAYPGLAFRQRVATACRLIRAGSDADAMKVLGGCRPASDEEKVELGYCRGFCFAMAGYRERRKGRREEARRALTEALRAVESCVVMARAVKHTRLLELYDTLESDPDLASFGE
jgi:hypothetical protein